MLAPAVSLAVATTLSFHPYAVSSLTSPEAGGTIAEQPAVTTAEQPPATTAEQPATTPEPPPQDVAKTGGPAPDSTPIEPRSGAATHEVKRPQTRSGVGLAVGAGIAGAAAWGLAIGKIALADRCNRDIESNDSIENTGDAQAAQVTLYNCFTDIKSILGLSVAGWFANWATWGLAAGAGGVRGKHNGVAYAWDGRPKQSAAGFIGGGAAVFGVGVVGIGLSRGLALTNVLKCDIDTEINNCATRTFRGYFAGVQVSSTLVAVGLGVMVYGLVYRKNRTMFKDRKVANLRIVPDASVMRTSGDYQGLALTGAF